jgi:hypothetical protein
MGVKDPMAIENIDQRYAGFHADPRLKAGPLKERPVTDKGCANMFIGTMVITFGLGLYALIFGHLSEFLAPIDGNN